MDETARILAVDDSITIRKALEMILAPAGYNIELAASGAEAITKAREFQPAVMLLDFILPDMRGIDVCNALTADASTKHIPVVLISARGAEIRQAYLAADNVVEYLVKPFTPDEVLSVIHAVLSSESEGLEGEEGIEAVDVQTEAPDEAAIAAEFESAPVEPGELAGEPIATDEAPEVDYEAAPPAPPVEEPAALTPPAPAWEPPSVVTADVEPEFEAEADVEVEGEIELEAVVPVAARPVTDQRELLEGMFETLRAGLEGVYVEESDIPSGAVADHARSYAELAGLLSQQLGETFAHATSGQRFALGADGSIRSLEEALLDAHRRVCRLLFRAVGAGVVDGQATSAHKPRVLTVATAKTAIARACATLSEQEGCHAFHITSDFGQLPLMARCYGPTHLVVDLEAKGALAELAKLHRLGDTRRIKVIGISADPGMPEASVAPYGVTTLLSAGPKLAEEIRACILGALPTETAGPATGASGKVESNQAEAVA